MGDWQKRHEAEWRAKGLCAKCGREKDNPKFSYCLRCRILGRKKSIRERARRKKDLTICTHCGGPRDSYTRDCSKCHKKSRLRSAINGPKQRKLIAGILCTRCHRPLHEEADAGKKTCIFCREWRTNPRPRRR